MPKPEERNNTAEQQGKNAQPLPPGKSDSRALREELIARRAYERFEERGREDGRDMDDWLEAEREFETGLS